jgi:ABC-type transport system substrate-binding protein
LSDLQSKELNLLSGISGQIISKIKDDPSLNILNSPMSNNFALFLNQNKQVSLRDQEFRQTLSRAIDRDQLVNQTLGGYALPVQNILGENQKSPTTEQLIKEIVADKDNGLFFENGVLYTGQKTTSSSTEREVAKISITTINNKELIETANFVAASWKKLGAEVEVKTIDRSQLQQVVRDRDFDTLLFGFNTRRLSDYKSFFHSEERTFPRLNIANFASKKADQLLTSLDAKTLPELSQILETEVPVIMLYKPVFVQALTGNIQVVMPEQINKEEDKYRLVNHWFTGTEKVLPWFELNVWMKDFARNMDLWIN